MSHTREMIGRISKDAGFRPEHVEKVLWLLDLLDGLMRHPFLADKLALKGGTALNLFHYPLPRLSVDVDLNYIGSADRETMLGEKPGIEKAIEGVCQRLGVSVRRRPAEHSGGKWSLRYPSVLTPGGNLELDLNYLLRVPLWPVQWLRSVPLGDRSCAEIPVLDLHELAAGKLAALFARSAPRDVFDAVALLGDRRIRKEDLRLGFVIYGAMNRRDWREVDVQDISVEEDQYRNEVSVLLRQLGDRLSTGAEMVNRCRSQIAEVLLPMRDAELEFLRLINEEGIIRPELLAAEEARQALVASHPALLWKVQSVRRFRGLSDP